MITVQEIEVWTYEQVVYAQPRIRLGEWDALSSLRFWDTNRSSNLVQINKPIGSQQKKRTFWIVDFPVSTTVKSKETEKIDKYLDLARELRKQWNMKVTVIAVVIAAGSIISKGLLKGLEDLAFGGKMETIQTTALLRSVKILRRVQET